MSAAGPLEAVAAQTTPASGHLSLWALLRADLARYEEFHRRAARRVGVMRLFMESLLFKAGFQAVLLYRLAAWLHAHGLRYSAWAVSRSNLFLTGADIEFGARIGPGLLVAHPNGIVVGRGTVIGVRATIFQGVTCGLVGWTAGPAAANPVIGDHVVLFARASVLGGIEVGSRVVIGAHALVTRPVPDGALASGTPATVTPNRGEALLREWGL